MLCSGRVFQFRKHESDGPSTDDLLPPRANGKTIDGAHNPGGKIAWLAGIGAMPCDAVLLRRADGADG